MFTKNEILDLLGSIFIISVVFGWNDGREGFQAGLWFLNFLKIILIVTFALLIHELGHKFAARRFNVETEYKIISVKRLWFTKKLKKSFPLWAFLALFLTVTSQGRLFFTGIGSNTIKVQEKRRVGRDFLYPTGYEEALIFLSGPLANIFLLLFITMIGKYSGINFNNFITVNLFIALWSMVPLPSFDGSSIYFGSRFLYIFGLTFIVVAFLLKFLSFPFTVLVSILIAGITTLFFYWRDQK